MKSKVTTDHSTDHCYLKTASDELTGNALASVAWVHCHHHHVVNLLQLSLRLKQLLGGPGAVQGNVQEVDVEGEAGQIWLTFSVNAQESDRRDRDERSLSLLIININTWTW